MAGGWGPGSRAGRRKSEKDPRLHPEDSFNIIDPTDPFITEFPIPKLVRLRSAALPIHEDQEKHKVERLERPKYQNSVISCSIIGYELQFLPR